MKHLLTILLLISSTISYAQTLKTGVLVVGSNESAFAAGIQAATSSVNTVIVNLDNGFNFNNLNDLEPIGSVQSFKKEAHKFLNVPDSLPLPLMDKELMNTVFKKWSDSSKFLNVINSNGYKTLKKISSGWELELMDGRKVRSKTLVLANDFEKTLAQLKIESKNIYSFKPFNYDNNVYRTSLAAKSNSLELLPYFEILNSIHPYLFTVSQNDLYMGQAIGAAAAFPVFFNRKLSINDLNKLQVELLTYKTPLFPLSDISIEDPNWSVIQETLLTGILKADLTEGKVIFNANKLVELDEIKQPLLDYYFKANIWLEDEGHKSFTLEQAISLVSVLGNKSVDVTRKTLEKNWISSYKFNSEFDLKKRISRREFSVLVGDFLQVFENSHYDTQGKILR